MVGGGLPRKGSENPQAVRNDSRFPGRTAIARPCAPVSGVRHCGHSEGSRDNGPEFQMRGRLGGFLFASVIGTLQTRALAQRTEPLHVERALGAEECPDEADLDQRVAAIRGRARLEGNASYEVEFSRSGDTFSATISSGRSGESQRVLEGRGTCASLAQATAVTLALLFDSDADHTAAPRALPPAPPPKPEPSLAPPSALDPSAPRPSLDGTLSLGVAGLAFVLTPLSPAFTGELGLHVGGFRAGLGVLWNPPQSLALESGQTKVSLLSGTVRACVALARARRIELDICSGLFAGAVSAKADGAGISDNAARTRSYLALPFELSLAQLSAPFGWEVSATALAALAHHDFEVEGLPVPYRAPRVGAMVTLRALALWPW